MTINGEKYLAHGSNPAVCVDMCNYSTSMSIKHPVNHNIHDHWAAEFSKVNHITVLLSGGVDSQFSALLAKTHCPNTQAVVFNFIWDHTVINADDVCAASRFAAYHKIPLQHIDIDIKHCLNKELSRICEKYACISPQIACHLYAIEQLTKESIPNTVFIMGTEYYCMPVKNGKLFLPGYKNQSFGHKISTYMLPYMILAKELGIQLIRDPFAMTPEILFLAHTHNATVFKEAGIYFESKNRIRTMGHDYKVAYYNYLIDGLIPPMIKRTGFELLKLYFASETGVYDEFNRRYRYKHAFRGKLFSNLQMLNKVKVTGDCDKAIDLCQGSYDLHSPIPCNKYVFDQW